MFAIPLFGAAALRNGAPLWLRIAALAGMCYLSARDLFYRFPNHRRAEPARCSRSRSSRVTAVANAIGVTDFLLGTAPDRSRA